jgi:hypothetical protein
MTTTMSSTDPDKQTLNDMDNVKNGTIKYNSRRKNKLQFLCGTLLDHIDDLEIELRYEKAKVIDCLEKDKAEKARLRADLKELKEREADAKGVVNGGVGEVSEVVEVSKV